MTWHHPSCVRVLGEKIWFSQPSYSSSPAQIKFVWKILFVFFFAKSNVGCSMNHQHPLQSFIQWTRRWNEPTTDTRCFHFNARPSPTQIHSPQERTLQVWPTNRVIQFIIQHNNLMLFGSPKQCNTKRINNCHPLALRNSLLCSALVRSPAELPLYLGDDVNTLPIVVCLPVWLSSIPTISPPKKN